MIKANSSTKINFQAMARYTLAFLAILTSLYGARVKAACEGLDFPESSANSVSADVMDSGNVILIRKNNSIVIDGKAKKNAFFKQTVEAPVFPQRLVKTRMFKVEGDKDITIDFTVETLTSQYSNTQDFLPTRTFAISELDASGNVNCIDGILGFSFDEGLGTMTIKKGTQIFPGENYDGTLFDPVQVSIREKGSNVTIHFEDIMLEAGKTYQFEFISQGEKPTLNNISVINEQYRLLFGNAAKIDIDDPNAGDGTQVDDVAQAEFFAADSTLDRASFFAISGAEVGITTLQGAIDREFKDIDIPANKYRFTLKQERQGKRKYIASIVDDTGKLTREVFRKPLLQFGLKKARSTARGQVTVKDDKTQIKSPQSYSLSRTGDKFFDGVSAGTTGFIKVIIQSRDKKGIVRSGFTNVKIINYEDNYLFANDIVFEVSDPDATINPRNAIVDGEVVDPNTPDGNYNFTVDPDTFEAVVVRDGETLNLSILENPIGLAVTDNSIFVKNGDVPDDERGLVTVEISNSGKELLKTLEDGDEIFVVFDLTSGSGAFEDSYVFVIIRKVAE